MSGIVLQEGNNEHNVAMTPVAAPVANLYGVVTDAETGQPIEGAKVTIDSLVTYTDANGYYRFEGLAVGSYDITFEKAGYE